MMRTLQCLVLGSLWAAPLISQVAIETEESRRSTRLVYAAGVAQPAELCIDYGPSTWRAAHAAEIESKSAAHFRLGIGFWTTLHTNAELVFGGKRVPPGTWYLGLFRSKDAKWHLSLMHASKIQRAGLISGSTRYAKPDVLVPLALRKTERPARELSIRLLSEQEPFGRARLIISWGDHEASAPFDLQVEIAKADSEPEFAGLDDTRAVRTESGLRYEEIRPGIGALPGPTSKVTVHYVGWLEDGTKFDSSFDRKQPVTFRLNAVIAGWQEGVGAMKPGAVFRLVIPPDLAYGDRGAGATIKPNSTLVFWIELLAVE